MTQFEKALSRIITSGMSAEGIVQVLKNLRETKILTGSMNSAVTLGFNADDELAPGDLVPTVTFSVMTVPEKDEEETVETPEKE